MNDKVFDIKITNQLAPIIEQVSYFPPVSVWAPKSDLFFTVPLLLLSCCRRVFSGVNRLYSKHFRFF